MSRDSVYKYGHYAKLHVYDVQLNQWRISIMIMEISLINYARYVNVSLIYERYMNVSLIYV